MGLSESEIQSILDIARTSMEAAGISPSPFAEEVGRRYLRKEITREEALNLIKEHHNLK